MSRFQACIGQTFPRSSPEAAGLQLTSAVSRMCLEVLRYCCQAAWSQPRSAIADWSCSCKPKHAFDLSESIWVGDGSRYIFKQLNQIQHNSTHIDINGSDFVSRTWGLSFQAASSWACQDFKWGNHLQTSSYHVAQPAKSHPLVKLQQVLQVWLSSWIHSFALAIARPVIFFYLWHQQTRTFQVWDVWKEILSQLHKKCQLLTWYIMGRNKSKCHQTTNVWRPFSGRMRGGVASVLSERGCTWELVWLQTLLL